MSELDCKDCFALGQQLEMLTQDFRLLEEVRGPGTCQCSDDDACMYARQRDRYREALAYLVKWHGTMERHEEYALEQARKVLEENK